MALELPPLNINAKEKKNLELHLNHSWPQYTLIYVILSIHIFFTNHNVGTKVWNVSSQTDLLRSQAIVKWYE